MAIAHKGRFSFNIFVADEIEACVSSIDQIQEGNGDRLGRQTCELVSSLSFTVLRQESKQFQNYIIIQNILKVILQQFGQLGTGHLLCFLETISTTLENPGDSNFSNILVLEKSYKGNLKNKNIYNYDGLKER